MPKKTTALKILVVDDHAAVLGGTLGAIKSEYPEASLTTETTASGVKARLSDTLPDLLVVDLAIPETAGDASQVETGIRLLKHIMEQYLELNIVVQSAHTRSLVRLKPAIDTHQGGFTIVDKGLSLADMLAKVDWALSGVIYTPRDMRNGIEVRPEWLEVLRLAFQSGLQDKAIAQQMNVAERTVRYYWTKVQNALDIYPEEGRNIRIQTEIRAREEGLLD